MVSSSRAVFLASSFAASLFGSVVTAPMSETARAVGTPETTADLAKRITHNGKATWFETGLGACGAWSRGTEMIVAISANRWNDGNNCDQYVSIKNTKNGKTAYGIVKDQCPGCADGSLDMSQGLFRKLGLLDDGVLPISWNFMPKGWSP